MRDDIDWKRLRKEYIEGDVSVAKLAKRYDVPEKTVRSRAQREKWSEQRADFREKISKKLAGALSEEYFKKINVSAEKLLRELERARKDLTKSAIIEREKGVNEEGHDVYRQRVIYVNDRRNGKVNAGELTKLIAGLDKLLDIGRKQAGDREQTITIEFVSPEDEDFSA